MTKQLLLDEKTEMLRRIKAYEDQMKSAQEAIYWLKKRLKPLEKQIEATPDDEKPVS